ncbi:DUF4097 family beta strand repeat protein [candidate division KSB1 bacterium]|nr:DUF4097 family beta strand repeat protein [candidate division KSB1 bacterium]
MSIKRIYQTQFVIILILSLLPLNAVSLAAERTELVGKDYPFNPDGEIILRNTNGSVSVQSWDEARVKIEAQKNVRGLSPHRAEEYLQEVKIDIEGDENSLTIDTYCPGISKPWNFFRFLFGGYPRVKVEYQIWVPRECDLELKTVNGGIDVSSVTGDLSINTTNGGIDTRDCRGSLRARTTNGGIRVELTEFGHDDAMDCSTTNGGIKAYLPEDLRADVYARTTNGSIETDFPIEIQGRFTGKRVEGKINGGGGSVELTTTNGSIKILTLSVP